MMSLNKSIILINILRFSIIVNSVEVLYSDKKNLEQAYREKVNRNGINNQNIYPLCGYDPILKDKRNLIVGTACKHAVDVLREDNQYENLYMDHIMYNVLEWNICEDREVILINTDLTLEMKESDKILQTMIKCWRRPALIHLPINKTKLKHLNEIFIYPRSHSFTEWLIFELDESKQTTFLKTWLRIHDFSSNLVPIHLFVLSGPVYLTSQMQIFSNLYPFINIWQEAVLETYGTHVLHNVDNFYFGKICRTIAGIDDFSHKEHIPKPNLKSMLLPLHQPNTNNVYSLPGLMWECDDFVNESDLLLFAAPADYTIIVVQIIYNQPKIVKLVENMFTEFLNYIF